MPNTLNQCEASRRNNPALEHSSCHQCSPKMFHWKLRFIEPEQATDDSCVFHAVWGFEQPWSLLWDPLHLENPCKCLVCVCTSCTYCLLGSYGTRAEMKTFCVKHCTQLIESEWMKYIILCYWTWMSLFSPGFWPKGFCRHSPLTLYQPPISNISLKGSA